MSNDLERLFLKPSGWLQSKEDGVPLSGQGTPLPWFTYGAIEFLHQVVRPGDRVFEFGAGSSTLWWGSKTRSVVSVEHDPEWRRVLGPKLPSNVELRQISIDAQPGECAENLTREYFARDRRTDWPYDEEKIIRRGLEDERFIAYAASIAEMDPAHDGFDFVVIDGMARRLCTWTALNQVKRDGFVVFDNSNRSDYDLAYELLDEAGFREIPFWGLAPGASFYTCTSFFTRSISRLPSAAFSGNILGLPEY